MVDHAETLQELYFDHCSILYQSGARLKREQWLDKHGYPKIGGENESWNFGYSTLPQPGEDHILTLESYPIRWYDAFDLFRKHLTHLRTFRFGTSLQWKFDTPNRRDDSGAGHPIMPWEAERDLKNQLFEERYIVYNDFGDEYLVHWALADEEVLDKAIWTTEELARFEKHPECAEEDEAALRNLLAKLGVTWHGGPSSDSESDSDEDAKGYGGLFRERAAQDPK